MKKKKEYILVLMILSALMQPLKAQSDTDNVAQSIIARAEAGHDVSQNMVGKWYFEGSHGLPQNYEKAVVWWKNAANQNNKEAIGNLGFCYYYGLGTRPDSSISARLFEKAFKLGYPELVNTHDSLANNGTLFSAMLLAHCCRNGIGMEKNAQKAFHYYSLAADRGNVEASYYCGKMLYDGKTVAADHNQGFSLMLRAADKGHAAAQYEIAGAYLTGKGVEKDASRAVEWYTRAANGGNWSAWWQLAECYREGTGTAQDFEKALNCYAHAATMGYQNKLKKLLEDDDSPWKDTPFMHYLRGMRLLDIDNNPDAALKEFGCVSKTNTQGVTLEALCLANPKCSKHNMKKAIKTLQRQAPKDERAMFELALCKIKGDGVDKDVIEAEQMLEQLAKNGYMRAINYLADCYFEGGILNQDKQKAVLLYLQAERLQQLNAVGATRLAQCFRNGEVVEADVERASKLEKYKNTSDRNILGLVRIQP